MVAKGLARKKFAPGGARQPWWRDNQAGIVKPGATMPGDPHRDSTAMAVAAGDPDPVGPDSKKLRNPGKVLKDFRKFKKLPFITEEESKSYPVLSFRHETNR